MEIKLASEHLTYPRKLSLQQMAKHSLVKKFWGELVIKETLYGRRFFIDFTIGKLITHGKAVLDNLLTAFSTYLPEKFMSGILHALIDLQEGYRKALFWEEKYRCALTLTILNPLTAGSYAAGYFILPGGHFDDLSLAKMFVADRNQCIQKRFQLACFYCFQDVILRLWHTMKIKRRLPCNGKLDQIQTEFGYLVGLWAYHIENRIYELIHENDNFQTCGFRAAVDGHHKHAAHFFWIRCCEIERRNFLQDFDLLYLSVAAKDNDAEFVHFIYSLLPIEKKNSLILRSMQRGLPEVPYIWCCLLHSEFWEYILEDIQSFPYHISSYIYKEVLISLFYNLDRFRIPVHKEIVRIIWKKFSQIDMVDSQSMLLITYLADINAIDLLETIIQPLSHSEKEKLLKEYPCGSVIPIYEFSNTGNYDAVHRYLHSFLIGHSHSNQRLSLRVNASKVLYYIEEQFFKCFMSEISETQKNEVRRVIESVRGSLRVLNQLLEKEEPMEIVRTT